MGRAHQVVMAAGSEYFYELFKEKSKEEFMTHVSLFTEVRLPEIDPHL